MRWAAGCNNDECIPYIYPRQTHNTSHEHIFHISSAANEKASLANSSKPATQPHIIFAVAAHLSHAKCSANKCGPNSSYRARRRVCITYEKLDALSLLMHILHVPRPTVSLRLQTKKCTRWESWKLLQRIFYLSLYSVCVLNANGHTIQKGCWKHFFANRWVENNDAFARKWDEVERWMQMSSWWDNNRFGAMVELNSVCSLQGLV